MFISYSKVEFEKEFLEIPRHSSCLEPPNWLLLRVTVAHIPASELSPGYGEMCLSSCFPFSYPSHLYSADTREIILLVTTPLDSKFLQRNWSLKIKI